MADPGLKAAGRLVRPVGRIRSFFGGFDQLTVLVTLALVAFGMLVMYSASLSISTVSLPRQALGVLLGLIAFTVVYRFDYRQLAGSWKLLLIIDCILIIMPLLPVLGYHARGISGWIRVPFIGLTFQTSELAKPVTVLLMAALGAQFKGRISSVREYLRLCGLLAIPFVLILLQPDLGTGLVVLVSGAVIIVMSGARRSWVLWTLGILVGLVVFVLVTDHIVDALVGDSASLIKDYQMNRLLVFLNPDADTSGSGYNLRQALIAVGSGGVFGRGIGNATQASMGFLPEAHTDFVFSLLAEEFGFVGSAALVIAFFLLIMGTLRVAHRCPVLYGKLICIGLAAMWTFQIFENIGMCLGLMPITGIPLPFISYGSSSMLSQLLCVGLVQSVQSHRMKAA